MSRNTLKLDLSGFEDMIRKLESLGGNVEEVVSEALQAASEKISRDTEAALDSSNLPASGRYSDGQTKQSIVQDSRVRWEGLIAWVPVGFDFSKQGAGGFLISGTPRYRPDEQLSKIYKQKRYMNQIQKEMSDVVLGAIIERM